MWEVTQQRGNHRGERVTSVKEILIFRTTQSEAGTLLSFERGIEICPGFRERGKGTLGTESAVCKNLETWDNITKQFSWVSQVVEVGRSGWICKYRLGFNGPSFA